MMCKMFSKGKKDNKNNNNDPADHIGNQFKTQNSNPNMNGTGHGMKGGQTESSLNPQISDVKNKTPPKASDLPKQKEREKLAQAVPPQIAKQYDVLSKLGTGSFGAIYMIRKKDETGSGTSNSLALKLEKKQPNQNMAFLKREAKIMTDLKEEPGFPRVYKYNKDEHYNFMIMSLLGSNLEELMKSNGGKFSLKTSVMLGITMIDRIRVLHSKTYIHRDIKPENFLIGAPGDHKTLYLIDFGLSKNFIDPEGLHIPYVDKKGMVGTARYASLNTHIGIEQSRRDDLESILYLMVYFFKGALPWQNLLIQDKKAKFNKIKEMKKGITAEQLCSQCPREFVMCLEYVKSLDFTQEPDYEKLKGWLHNVMRDNKLNLDYEWDWNKLYPSANTTAVSIDSSKKGNYDEIELPAVTKDKIIREKEPSNGMPGEGKIMINILKEADSPSSYTDIKEDDDFNHGECKVFFFPKLITIIGAPIHMIHSGVDPENRYLNEDEWDSMKTVPNEPIFGMNKSTLLVDFNSKVQQKYLKL